MKAWEGTLPVSIIAFDLCAQLNVHGYCIKSNDGAASDPRNPAWAAECPERLATWDGT